MSKRNSKRSAKSGLLCCEDCGGGLDASDLAYGLVCPACGVRVAGPFTEASEVPAYKVFDGGSK